MAYVTSHTLTRLLDALIECARQRGDINAIVAAEFAEAHLDKYRSLYGHVD
jgi:hypothetical protein